MRKLIAFNHVSLDGFFVDANNSMMWAKPDHKDPEWQDFVVENSNGDGPLIFGRITYQLMSSYWPTPMAKQHDAAVAERMNTLPKIVFSRTLDTVSWNNSRLATGDLVTEIRKLKQESGDGMAILGSGTIVSQLTEAGLIDEYQMVVNPIILGKGRTMFEGVTKNLNLKLTSTRTFRNGNIFLRYEPVA